MPSPSIGLIANPASSKDIRRLVTARVSSQRVFAIRTVPGFGEGGQVEARRQMVLSLTFDHAFVDGAPAAEFLAEVRKLLEGRTG